MKIFSSAINMAASQLIFEISAAFNSQIAKSSKLVLVGGAAW